jgi:hypothetical protein
VENRLGSSMISVGEVMVRDPSPTIYSHTLPCFVSCVGVGCGVGCNRVCGVENRLRLLLCSSMTSVGEVMVGHTYAI